MLRFSPRTARPRRLAGSLVAIALIGGACSAGATASPSAPPASAAPASSAPASAAAASGDVYTITAVDNATLGKYLTGEDGKTLYTFKPDSSDTSTCVDQCAGIWPPFVLEGSETAVAGAGVTGKIATFKRPDGSLQVSYNGRPVYYYSKDTKAGDTTGQGLGAKWFVAAP